VPPRRARGALRHPGFALTHHGTATPIQTEFYELWDLLGILNAGADAVLGRELFGRWSDWRRAVPLVKGDETPADERDAWEWLRHPPPSRVNCRLSVR
jgi:hypothetical protein